MFHHALSGDCWQSTTASGIYSVATGAICGAAGLATENSYVGVGCETAAWVGSEAIPFDNACKKD